MIHAHSEFVWEYKYNIIRDAFQIVKQVAIFVFSELIIPMK